MSEHIDVFLGDWHRMVAEKDTQAIDALLADDVDIGAPPYLEKIEGRALVGHLLGLILHTIEDFTYHRRWRDGGEIALEFTGRVGELSLQGIDLITLNDRGEVQHIDVLMRPINAIEALRDTIRPQMLAYLQGGG
jgi:hypothetical protein